MKYIAIALMVLLMAGPVLAMTNNQTSYLKGIEDGWHLCYLRYTDINAYNIEVDEYNREVNSSLNESEARFQWLAPATAINYTLPEVFT